MKPNYFFSLREDLKDDKQFLPTKGEELATGWDVRAAQEDRKPIVIEPFQYVKIPLGFRAFCPAGWWLELRPRSSTFAKKNLHSLYGVIDEAFPLGMVFSAQYIPELTFCEEQFTANHFAVRIFDKSAYQSLTINFGDAIGQLVPVERQEMDTKEISNEEYDSLVMRRGAERKGGFGSTDKNGNK